MEITLEKLTGFDKVAAMERLKTEASTGNGKFLTVLCDADSKVYRGFKDVLEGYQAAKKNYETTEAQCRTEVARLVGHDENSSYLRQLMQCRENRIRPLESAVDNVILETKKVYDYIRALESSNNVSTKEFGALTKSYFNKVLSQEDKDLVERRMQRFFVEYLAGKKLQSK